MKIELVTISFPDIPLKTRDGHKLRGFFGNFFKDHSPLLHNHFDDGTFRYAYPLVQYKVVENIPYLVGIGDGARLLIDLFLNIRHLEIEGQKYSILSKQINRRSVELMLRNRIITYKFVTPWMALSQKNFRKYVELSQGEKKQFLTKILIGNILSFYKSVDFRVEQTVDVILSVRETPVLFKNRKMIGFKGEFATNAVLPELIGVGRSVSRGFGTVKSLR